MEGIDYSTYPIQIGQGAAPLPKKTGFKIWSTPPGDASTLFVISPRAVIVWTHWHKEIARTVFCGGKDCMIDHERNAPEWSGYLLVNRVGYSGREATVIWHITPYCSRFCPDLCDAALDLRPRPGRCG